MYNKMKQSFKKYFIPHEENDHAPHFLRTKSMVFVVGMIFAAEALFLLNKFALSNTNLFALIFPDVLIAQTNQNRELNSLTDLSTSPVLQAAAELKAKDMATKGYFAHVSPEGITPWHWFDEAGYKYAYAGENLAINFSDSKDITDAWMNSPLHRANILNGHFTEIGIATAKGIYGGNETTFVVQMFGKPLAVAVAPEPMPTPAPTPIPALTPKPIPVPAPAVSGASDTKPAETFVAVKGAETEPQALESVTPKETGTAKPPGPVAVVETALSSPRQNVNTLLFLIASVIAAALVLKVFIKIRIQRPKLIASGLMVLALAVLAILINEKISLALASIV